MPRKTKPRLPTVPISADFHFPLHVWDAISMYAYKHNRCSCAVMQDFLEIGLLQVLQYDSDLLQRFNLMEHPSSMPFDHASRVNQG